MPFTVDAVKPPLHDQRTELQRKIQLLEGDRAAFYESSQSTIKKNQESIRQLRQENKRLYKKLAEAKAGDEHVVGEAFHNRGLEKDAFRNMSGRAALATVDQKVLSKTKRLNALKHTTQTYQQRLAELKLEYNRMKPGGGGGGDAGRALSSDARARKREEDATKLRALENRLEKTQLKCKEAESIMAYYLKLKRHLQDESLTFQVQLDGLEAEILKHREELHNLQVMNNDAQLSREAAKAELHQQEDLLSKERKERERIITSYRKMVEERRAQAERVDRKVQRPAVQPDELSSEAQRSTTRMAAEEERAVSSFEDAFRRIKDATGVTDIHEIVERFVSQKETHRHLEKLKGENEEVLQQLKEQKELLHRQFEEIRYSGEAKLSKEQQQLEECEQQLQAQQLRCDTAKESLDWLLKTLSTVRAGVEHLAEKLQHIALSEDRAAEVRPDSDELVLQLLIQSELKLQALQAELEGADLDAIMKEMEEDEFYVRIEGKLPEYNTRVRLPEDRALEPPDDEDGSEEDSEGDVVSREALKRQSQLIIESNSKKKTWKKKKGKF
ncbi:coiled-coil domain-containing protein 151 isoform X2 [Kryptolebias marmoratus]|uniref:coiled-coil domain-containing protein 151 isoform X2 n=1 Tax=Kryptolebias marmoratus TaxID=37003 RepID=UPI0007F89B04|nr:coiled-coil domain-containing protein 151 isoform X2 [Kryptolebias marmoratus]